MNSYLYRLDQKSTGMWYIGSRTANKGSIHKDKYICSSKTVKPLILSNKNDWVRTILVIGDANYISELESKYLTLLDAKNDINSYNRSNSGKIVTSGMIRMYKENVNIFVNKSEVTNYLQLGYVNGFSDNTKAKMKSNHADVSGENNPMYGISRIGHNLGFKHTDATKKKLSGPKTVDHKEKLSIAKQGINNPSFGKKQSLETCKKRSESLKGRVPWNKGLKKSANSINSRSKSTEIFERSCNKPNQRSKN